MELLREIRQARMKEKQMSAKVMLQMRRRRIMMRMAMYLPRLTAPWDCMGIRRGQLTNIVTRS